MWSLKRKAHMGTSVTDSTRIYTQTPSPSHEQHRPGGGREYPYDLLYSKKRIPPHSHTWLPGKHTLAQSGFVEVHIFACICIANEFRDVVWGFFVVFYMNCTCDGVKSLLYVILEIKMIKERGPAESDWCDRGRKGKLGFSQRYSRQHCRSPAALHMYTQQEPCWHTPSAHLYRLLSRLPLTVWPSRLIHPLSLHLSCRLFHSHNIAFISAWTLHSSPHLSPPIFPVPNLARSCCSTIHLPQSLTCSMNMPAFSFINTFAFICFRPCGFCFTSFSECL